MIKDNTEEITEDDTEEDTEDDTEEDTEDDTVDDTEDVVEDDTEDVVEDVIEDVVKDNIEDSTEDNIDVEVDIEDAVDNDNKNVCCICLSTIKENDNVKTSCNHTFCFTCLLEHLKIKNTCPCCRTPIEPIRKNKNLIEISASELEILIKYNITRHEDYIKHIIEKIKSDLIVTLLMNDTNTTNVDTIFKTELLNITKSEIFNKTMGRLLFKEFFGLTAYLSLGSMCNLVEWLNQTILTN